MAFRYLIYSTGTTFSSTIIRESLTNNPSINEASYYTDFMIPEIQPLYLWRVNNVVTPTNVIPNTDANIGLYLDSVALTPTPDDLATIGDLTGETTTKIDKVSGVDGQVPVFTADGNIEDSGFSVAEISGLTTYTFVESGNTQISQVGNQITIYVPTGDTTATWGSINGTLSAQTDLWNTLTGMTGETATKLDIADFNSYTGDTEQWLNAIDDDIIYLSGQTDTKLAISDFNSYSGATETRLGNIEDDIEDLQSDVTGLTATKLNISTFNAYTGSTQPILDGALTGVTNLGTGTTLGGTSARNVTFKSISAVGGVTLLGDGNNLIISGETNATTTWGNIIGTLSNQTDLWNTLTGMTAETDTKLDIVDFNSYSGTTNTRLNGIDDDINYLSGQTDTKLAISTFNSYTGATDTRIGDIEDDVTELYNESIINVTGATNGLSKSGSKDVKLGGALTEDTVISGTSYDLTINVDNITLQSVGAIQLIDANGVGGVSLESDGGIVKLQGNDNTSTPITKIEVGESTLLITDDRAIPRGIQYADNYTGTFQNRSLVDKEYVDSVATGLIPKANVKVATTTNITLSNTQTIDGIPVVVGNRVLVKNQTNAEDNGIYVVAAGAWSRSTDFDGTPDGEVSDGNLIPVLSGDTYGNTLWVLVTQNPIVIGTTELEFTLFSSPLELQAGVGIGITGQTIAVDGQSLAGNSITWSGNTFNVNIATGSLGTALSDISDDISDINADISYISGQTDTKLAITTFSSYTGTTDTLLNGIEDDIDYISGVTDNNFSIFTGYTASTVTNQIQLVHTGGTDINTVAATGIVWHSVTHSGSSFSWTGGTNIKINKTADYEVSYHVPHGHTGTNNIRGIASNLVVNGVTILNNTVGASATSRGGMIANLVLPNTILSLTANDVLELIAYRTGLAGVSNTVVNGVILIKEKNKLQ